MLGKAEKGRDGEREEEKRRDATQAKRPDIM